VEARHAHVNILMLAVITRRARVPLIWSVLDNKGGTSDSGERFALMQRSLAIFGAASVRLVLADREFIGLEWMDFLNKNNIPFAIRMKEKLTVATEDGRRLALGSLLRKCRGVRNVPGCSWRGPAPPAPAELRRQTSRGRRVAHRRLQYPGPRRARGLPAKRWAIECLFGETKTRGLNLEDTRLVTPRKPPCSSASSPSRSPGPRGPQPC
jgi:Transposase DDE domain